MAKRAKDSRDKGPDREPRPAAGREPERIRLYLLLDYSSHYTRSIMRGAVAYHSPRRAFRVVTGTPDNLDQVLRDIEEPAIAMFRDRAAQQAALHRRYPVVNVSDMAEDLILPRVVPDHRTVGRMAAEHLLSKGLRYFAFLGGTDRLLDTRRAGFAAALAGRGLGYAHLSFDQRLSPSTRAAALKRLPKPVGVMAGNDHLGRWLIDACGEIGLSVPGDVAVIGVDDDEVPCLTVPPFMSSIDTDGERVGFEAARLIDRLLDGEPPPAAAILVQPKGVVERESTDVLAVGDAELVRAVRYIRDCACEGVTAEGVAAALRIPPRSMRDKFRRHLNTTVRAEILRVRFDAAKRLLVETNLTIDRIGRQCGFPHYGRFNAAFRKTHGMPPGVYRRQFVLR